MLQVVIGSIFDTTCDLLIIPCDSFGGVTQSVFTNLKNKKLPISAVNTEYGTVNIFPAKSQIARYIGFAASVLADTSSSDVGAVEKIARHIARFAENNKLQFVNIPLLGAGAGGLRASESFEVFRKVFSESNNNITYTVHCFSRDVFESLNYENKSLPEALKNPRVFISYCGFDGDNTIWVDGLTKRLRKNGIDARIDLYDISAGTDLPSWMTSEILQAEKVILVCDKIYVERANLMKPSGVGWETMIIQADLLYANINNTKYIAIMRENNVDEGLPIFQRSKLALNWSRFKNVDDIDDKEFKKLLQAVFEVYQKPQLGPIPNWVRNPKV